MGESTFRLVFGAHGVELAAARACEAAVFADAYGNTSAQFEAEYGVYEPDTIFLAVLDGSGRAVAAARVIRPGPAGLKSINDLCRAPWRVDGVKSAAAAGVELDRCWDVATIAVRRDSGRAGVSAAALYHGLVAGCRANGIDFVVMIMDERARRLLSASGITTERLPGTAAGEYLGSPASTPLFGDLTTMFDVQRRLNPEAYRMVFQGVGLDGISLPRPEQWRLSVEEPVPAFS
jgi:hypothetical protein